MLQHLTSGNWGIMIRRPLESATRALPLVFILFAPLFFGLRYLYGAWLNPAPGHEGRFPLSNSTISRRAGSTFARSFILRCGCC